MFGLEYGLGAQWYVALPLALIGYLGLRYGRDMRQNLSWKLGYDRGKAEQHLRQGPMVDGSAVVRGRPFAWTDGQKIAAS